MAAPASAQLSRWLRAPPSPIGRAARRGGAWPAGRPIGRRCPGEAPPPLPSLSATPAFPSDGARPPQLGSAGRGAIATAIRGERDRERGRDSAPGRDRDGAVGPAVAPSGCPEGRSRSEHQQAACPAARIAGYLRVNVTLVCTQRTKHTYKTHTNTKCTQITKINTVTSIAALLPSLKPVPQVPNTSWYLNKSLSLKKKK